MALKLLLDKINKMHTCQGVTFKRRWQGKFTKSVPFQTNVNVPALKK